MTGVSQFSEVTITGEGRQQFERYYSKATSSTLVMTSIRSVEGGQRYTSPASTAFPSTNIASMSCSVNFRPQVLQSCWPMNLTLLTWAQRRGGLVYRSRVIRT